MFPEFARDDVFWLETRRMWLRWPRASDAAEIVRLAGDKAVAEMTGRIPHPYPEGEAGRFIEGTRRRNGEGRSLTLMMALKGNPDVAVGALGLDMQRQPGSPPLGYWVGKPHWGRGLATEAAQALIDFGFLFTEAAEITAMALVMNPASRRVLEKCGFAYVGCGLESRPARGGMASCDRFRLDRKAWSSLKGWRVPEWVREPRAPGGAQAGCPA